MSLSKSHFRDGILKFVEYLLPLFSPTKVGVTIIRKGMSNLKLADKRDFPNMMRGSRRKSDITKKTQISMPTLADFKIVIRKATKLNYLVPF